MIGLFLGFSLCGAFASENEHVFMPAAAFQGKTWPERLQRRNWAELARVDETPLLMISASSLLLTFKQGKQTNKQKPRKSITTSPWWHPETETAVSLSAFESYSLDWTMDFSTTRLKTVPNTPNWLFTDWNTPHIGNYAWWSLPGGSAVVGM